MRRLLRKWESGIPRNRDNRCRYGGVGKYKVRWHREKIALIARILDS